jgi:hypothetical protein
MFSEPVRNCRVIPFYASAIGSHRCGSAATESFQITEMRRDGFDLCFGQAMCESTRIPFVLFFPPVRSICALHTTVPNKAPTPAVSPIASAPQKVTRIAPTAKPAPPAPAANAPKSARNSSEVPGTRITRASCDRMPAISSHAGVETISRTKMPNCLLAAIEVTCHRLR